MVSAKDCSYLPVTNILGMNVHVGNRDSAVKIISDWAQMRLSRYVCVSNVHMCMEAYDSGAYKKLVNDADLVVADGMPLVWAQKLIGQRDAQRIRGADLMDDLCRVAAGQSTKIGLYGSSNATLQKLKKRITTKYPDVDIVYAYSPPFQPHIDESSAAADEINRLNVGLLFVGLGCPKQEIWMSHNRDRLECVQVGVGAAFDFIAGVKNTAPEWMQKCGLEWLFRLLSEPRRLAWRYFKHNPRFIWYITRQLLRGRRGQNCDGP